MTLFLLYTYLFLNIPLYTSDTPNQNGKPLDSIRISVLLSPGDEAGLFQETICLARRLRFDEAFSISIIAMEPGPLVLSGGLRLLPQEVYPEFSVPHLLILSLEGNPPLERPFLGFLRACLQQGTEVLVVADRFPDVLVEFPLEPTQRITRCDPREFGACLVSAFEQMDEPPQIEESDSYP